MRIEVVHPDHFQYAWPLVEHYIVAALEHAQGGKLFTGQDTWQQFVDLLKSRGATRIEGAVRDSMARLWARYGAEEKYRIFGLRI